MEQYSNSGVDSDVSAGRKILQLTQISAIRNAAVYFIPALMVIVLAAAMTTQPFGFENFEPVVSSVAGLPVPDDAGDVGVIGRDQSFALRMTVRRGSGGDENDSFSGSGGFAVLPEKVPTVSGFCRYAPRRGAGAADSPADFIFVSGPARAGPFC